MLKRFTQKFTISPSLLPNFQTAVARTFFNRFWKYLIFWKCDQILDPKSHPISMEPKMWISVLIKYKFNWLHSRCLSDLSTGLYRGWNSGHSLRYGNIGYWVHILQLFQKKFRNIKFIWFNYRNQIRKPKHTKEGDFYF